MIENEKSEVWFLTGSQHLYGEETLRKVAKNSQEIAETIGRYLGAPAVSMPAGRGPGPLQGLCVR